MVHRAGIDRRANGVRSNTMLWIQLSREKKVYGQGRGGIPQYDALHNCRLGWRCASRQRDDFKLWLVMSILRANQRIHRRRDPKACEALATLLQVYGLDKRQR